MPDASVQLCAMTASATGAGTVGGVVRTVFPLGRANASAKVRSGLFQVEITATGSVNIEGRSSSSAPWVVITTLTASGGVAVELFNEMRANVTANSGTVNSWLSQ